MTEPADTVTVDGAVAVRRGLDARPLLVRLALVIAGALKITYDVALLTMFGGQRSMPR